MILKGLAGVIRERGLQDKEGKRSEASDHKSWEELVPLSNVAFQKFEASHPTITTSTRTHSQLYPSFIRPKPLFTSSKKMSFLLVSSLLHRPLLPLPLKRSLSTAYSFGTSLHGALGIESHASGFDHIVSQPVLTNVHSASAGWGHSIYLRKDGSLFITGKPHEFQSLLRINRLPRIVAEGLSWLNNLGVREDKQVRRSVQDARRLCSRRRLRAGRCFRRLKPGQNFHHLKQPLLFAARGEATTTLE